MLGLIMALAVSASQVQVVNADTVFTNGRPYRLYRVDVPRVDSQCALERERAEMLTAFMSGLISSAHNIDVQPGFDPRGRKSWPTDHRGVRLARISVDGQDLGAILIANGFAFQWDNHYQRNWCLPHP